ncbi:two-component sensor histidine kinase [Wolbachia endosymbiont of Diaphorina citri]|jgi:Signal transduction histidine kinase|uniref:sensor histidine kinase n=1 Tax=Wolbachia endosymbiont of Diaphorina citri TaxID=116598 RepID=UPI0002E7B73A|nr:ATP-binding protein [Wolbachia endosymbiont of Diaphorina citri]QJT94524.1 two-component sensor histidine kinase [Wolbachia endosymbiont of Diaphorina citri]QJT95764.1 two-component sensor histidine kinase [Wolbachia endosymbiont of Diaphorina citri]QJT97126.1 two-component sensor histidine kinase [Wolbachia endosymbiont of Diaphorina citri]QLK11422.1 two-component sensor histidine kinase [Wolbachia endosymbiont of Diaphorina citri]QXY87047.1 two-component sensor histidine kinase [Wolbachia
MYKLSKLIFTKLKKNRYTKIITLFLLIFVILFSAIYRNYSLRNNFLSFYRDSNANLKSLLENGIIKKYNYLLIEKHHVKYNTFDYINQLVKLRAELLQSVSEVKNLSLILYDQNARVIFSNFNTQGHDYEQLLTNDEFDKLLSNQEIFYATGNTLTSAFPIFHEDDIKPSFFLKIIQSYNDSYIMVYSLFSIFMGLLLIILILIMLYLHFSNTQMLAKQHKTNIELQRVKEALEQENANKIKFFASVTHELRTPLNAIIGFAKLIKNETLGSVDHSQYKEYIDDIYNAGTHLLALINDVLDFSKAESSSLTVEKVKFNLNKIIDSCLNMLSPKLKETGISLKKEITNKQLLVIADPKRMKQVIINLLSNAIKFTPKDGLIRMVIKENIEKNLLTIEFHDNGIGIMQQDIYKVMSVFGQADSGYRNEGTGIGLPLSKKLVELMGGTFSIKSEAKLGTTITLNFFYEEQTCEDLIDF